MTAPTTTPAAQGISIQQGALPQFASSVQQAAPDPSQITSLIPATDQLAQVGGQPVQQGQQNALQQKQAAKAAQGANGQCGANNQAQKCANNNQAQAQTQQPAAAPATQQA